MAVTESLLPLIAAQGADALVIAPNQPPTLRRGGTEHPLSMPNMAPEMIEMIVEEVVNGDGRPTLDESGSLETSHTTTTGDRYSVQIQRADGSYRFEFTPGPQEQTRTPAAATVEVTTPLPAAVGGLLALLERVQQTNATDLILSSGANGRMRVATELREVPGSMFDEPEILGMLDPVLTEPHRETFEHTGSVDLGLEVELMGVPTRFRVNLFRQRGGLAAAFRPVRTHTPTLGELNLPDDLYELVSYPSGMVLMAGTAGSGKSTTLVALIEHLNRTTAKHIITLEDPIEYNYTCDRSLIHQRELGEHVDSFGSGLRAALRESPDVILVGEMRDRATISAALTAAETGHLVLSTLHSSSGPMAIDRIVDVFPEHQQTQVRYQLSSVLRAVVTQFLLPGRTRGVQVPAYEKMLVTTAVGAKIRENRCHQIPSEIQKGRSENMVPLELSLARLVRSSRIDMKTALTVARDAELLIELTRS